MYQKKTENFVTFIGNRTHASGRPLSTPTRQECFRTKENGMERIHRRRMSSRTLSLGCLGRGFRLNVSGNDKTVEFRLFDTTDQPWKLYAYMEFVDALIRFTMQARLDQLDEVSFTDYVNEKTERYPNLAYLVSKYDPKKDYNKTIKPRGRSNDEKRDTIII